MTNFVLLDENLPWPTDLVTPRFRAGMSWTARTFGSWGRIPLEAWVYSCVFMRFSVLCIQSPCNGRSHAQVVLSTWIVSEINSESEQGRGPNSLKEGTSHRYDI